MDNTRDRLLSMRLQRPFVPFRITLADGSRIEITRQLGFAVGPSLMLVAQDPPPAMRVKYDQVVTIEELERVA
jgi:hypothetical protein